MPAMTDPAPVRILHVAGEVHPFQKTGGLADVVGALPDALHALGFDVRVLMPGYGAALERARNDGPLDVIAHWRNGRLLASTLPRGCPIWFYETEAFIERWGNPYDDAAGFPWPDNADRFDELARVAAAVADDAMGVGWRPDVVHAHDWHTGLLPVHLMLARVPAASVFTVHNLAYQGLFELAARERLGLPGWLEHWQALEFRGLLSFMKGGLGFADKATTVSHSYAREIRRPEFGEGLDGLLASRGADLVGIANGIDTETWNPATDPNLPATYSADAPEGKAAARNALLQETGLKAGARTPILAFVGRLAAQKGIDILCDALDELVALPAAVVVLGSGDPAIRARLEAAAKRHPTRVHVTFAFDEPYAHRLYAGADMLLMPSRFEPCGLSQLNAMRYGTIPVVQRTGGLIETVTDFTETGLADGRASGFQFDRLAAATLVAAVRRARDEFRRPARWRQLMTNAMRRDVSWTRSAREYAALYEDALDVRRRRFPHHTRHHG